MARKPENTFIASVHKMLPNVYFEKMYNPYRSGTPDVWYSGNKSDLWVEYKFIQQLPVKADIVLDLSQRQREWLRLRYNEGRNVAVIGGCKQGGVVFTDLEWDKPISPDQFRDRMWLRYDIAKWIHDRTSSSMYASTKSTLDNSKVRKRSVQSGGDLRPDLLSGGTPQKRDATK